MPKDNNRLSPRVEVKVSVQVERQSRLQEFFCRNLSGGGIFLEMNEFPEIGEEFKMRFTIPGQKDPIILTAKVVRHQEFNSLDHNLRDTQIKGVGLQFINVTNKQKKLIEKFIQGRALALAK